MNHIDYHNRYNGYLIISLMRMIIYQLLLIVNEL